jgi:NADPH:quinone reductase-like Zn-dependent oxidoreductase
MSKDEMRAVAIDRFGGPEVLMVRDVAVPELGPNQILVQVESAGIGVWDVAEREGMLVTRLGIQPKFPWVLGSEGAGKIIAVGEKVTGFRKGDLVYGHVWGTNPKAGFYAEYTALNADQAWPIPSTITAEQAGALLIDGGTALRGLDDTLNLKKGEKLMVFGASGGLGHLAIQLGKRLGARVFAIASGEDGVALARRLGAEAAVDGHGGDIGAPAREFAPDGFDAALITVRGQAEGAVEAAESALTTVREGGRVAYPWTDNIRPPPRAPSNVRLDGYMLGNMDRALVTKLNKLIEADAFEVHLGKTFTLDQAVDAYRAVGSHHLGRLALLPAR